MYTWIYTVALLQLNTIHHEYDTETIHIESISMAYYISPIIYIMVGRKQGIDSTHS